MISWRSALACLAVLVCLAASEVDIPTEDEVTAMMAAQYRNLVAKLQQKDAREHIQASMGAPLHQAVEQPTTQSGEARVATTSVDKAANQKQQAVDFPGFALPAEAAAIIRDAREKFEAMKAQLAAAAAAAANMTQQAPAGASSIN